MEFGPVIVYSALVGANAKPSIEIELLELMFMELPDSTVNDWPKLIRVPVKKININDFIKKLNWLFKYSEKL
jgi:hypothetical protein